MTINYHEKETVVLRSAEAMSRLALDDWLRSRGFKSEDEFYFISRKGKAKPWQSTTVMTVNVYLRGKAVYETEDDVAESGSGTWDELRLDYLMASLPRTCITEFVQLVDELARQFNLQIEVGGRASSVQDLTAKFEAIADELVALSGGPGAEDLALLVEQNYPRR